MHEEEKKRKNSQNGALKFLRDFHTLVCIRTHMKIVEFRVSIYACMRENEGK